MHSNPSQSVGGGQPGQAAGSEPLAAAFQGMTSAMLSPSQVAAVGAGNAYQSVAQSAAIAIQDATENLRNLSSIGSTAIGVAMAQYLSTGKPEFKDAIERAQAIVSQATADFRSIGEHAAFIVNSFPTGVEQRAS
jgi:hypothetical protein